MKSRALREHEKWSPPRRDLDYGTIKVRITCRAWPEGRCVNNATVIAGGRRGIKLCKTHLRMLREGKQVREPSWYRKPDAL